MICLPGEAKVKLIERALATGQDLTRYAEQLLTRELMTPLSLVEAAELPAVSGFENC